jgi:DNA-directed RNA polymerase subunit RPC12/RpoP
MVVFFCARCGTQLEVPPDVAGRDVRCGNCTRIVPSPTADAAWPAAAVVIDDEEVAVDESDLTEAIAAEVSPQPFATLVAAAPLWPLAYQQPWRPPSRWRPGELELLAERLEKVEAPAVDRAAMSECPYCGSTIAGYVGRCPFCRHPLRGS